MSARFVRLHWPMLALEALRGVIAWGVICGLTYLLMLPKMGHYGSVPPWVKAGALVLLVAAIAGFLFNGYVLRRRAVQSARTDASYLVCVNGVMVGQLNSRQLARIRYEALFDELLQFRSMKAIVAKAWRAVMLTVNTTAVFMVVGAMCYIVDLYNNVQVSGSLHQVLTLIPVEDFIESMLMLLGVFWQMSALLSLMFLYVFKTIWSCNPSLYGAEVADRARKWVNCAATGEITIVGAAVAMTVGHRTPSDSPETAKPAVKEPAGESAAASL